MKRFIPRSLVGQTTIVLLVGLTVSHIFSMSIYTADRATILTMAGGHQLSHRVAAITRLLDETPAEWRDQILKATNSQTLSVTVKPVSRLLEEESSGIINSLLKKYLERLIGTDDESRIVVQVIDVQDHPDTSITDTIQVSNHPAMTQIVHGRENGQLLRASVRLKDGNWLNFAAVVPADGTLWSIRTVLSMTLMALGVIMISLWVIRRVTRPLLVFTAASKRLGKDVNAPPLVVGGPTELQEATLAFNEMQKRLKQLIENRTQMLAAISHDLRTPITLLRLRTESIEDGEEKEKMKMTLAEMEAMISSTLSFAREDAENEDLERVNLTALVASVCDDLSDAGYQIEFTETEEIILECRPRSLRRALSNLIENAHKYGERVVVEITKQDTTIEIAVTDNGPGIPEEELEKVFLPFYRVDSARGQDTGGIGLGLSVVQAVVDKHGGEIKLENQPGGGLKARIILPG